MYRCNRCSSDIDDGFDRCWNCNEAVPSASGTATLDASMVFANFRTFRGVFASWPSLFADAARFATEVGRDRVISISHSADRSDGVVTVWYWDEGDPSRDGALPTMGSE